MLAQRMQRHGRTMMFLLMDVVTLSHEEAAEEADAIAAEPRFGRPAPGEKGTISALLPTRFFDLEDQLQAQARELSRAAQANDDRRLAAAYGQLTQSCVGCHLVYLYPDEKPESGD
ncbi:MAG TPA: cytochrome c [Polyangiaceae bacterium]|nr:cytochrome c [Polyangiaceae bacterium]